jgi:hypothetical protein
VVRVEIKCKLAAMTTWIASWLRASLYATPPDVGSECLVSQTKKPDIEREMWHDCVTSSRSQASTRFVRSMIIIHDIQMQ